LKDHKKWLDQYIKNTKEYLTEFEEIPFSKSVRVYLPNIIHFFKVLLNDFPKKDDFMETPIEMSIFFENNDQIKLNQSFNINHTNSQISNSGVLEMKEKELKNLNTTIQSNINLLKSVVKILNDSKYSSEEVQFSTCVV